MMCHGFKRVRCGFHDMYSDFTCDVLGRLCCAVSWYDCWWHVMAAARMSHSLHIMDHKKTNTKPKLYEMAHIKCMFTNRWSFVNILKRKVNEFLSWIRYKRFFGRLENFENLFGRINNLCGFHIVLQHHFIL